jgi:hypothetical protein
MAKSYTITSDPFYVNGNVTMSGANTFTQQEISLPLDSLGREGIIVHAIYFDTSRPEAINGTTTQMNMQVTSTSQTTTVGVNNSNLLALREIMIASPASGVLSGPHVLDWLGSDAPYQKEDNLGIVATDNVFLGMATGSYAGVASCNVRLVCSRIKLSADAYAALVTNELTS